jgi:UPF0755 protein
MNRLKKNMRLESDPTIRYGIDGGKVEWGQPIMKTERAQKNTHNTYQMHGLPATPICNPGRAAIAAVLNPSSTKDLFFVADGKGGHIFAETADDHYANVKKWRVIEREIREKEKEREAKAEKDKEAAAKAEKASKDKADTPSSPTAAKGSEKGPEKGQEKGKDKGKAATSRPPLPQASKSGTTQEGAWSSTTEPAPKAKR